MSKAVDHLREVIVATITAGLLVVGSGCSSDAGGPVTPDASASSGGSAGSATGGSGGSGGAGSGGAVAGSGGASTGGVIASGGTRDGGAGGGAGARGGSSGSGGGAGGAGSGQPDARPADAVSVTDGATPKGGAGGGSSGSGGGAGGGGQTGSGGSIADAAVDAVADVAPGRDLAIPDAPPIPDLPVRQDAAPDFWPAPFAPDCAPPAIGGRAQTDGHHRPGEDCMRSGCHLNPGTPEHHAGTDCRGSGCHSNGSPDGTGAPAFLWGGTVYRAATLVADRGVEVAVRTTQGYYSACSASNGNFWVLAPTTGTKTLTWTGASTRLRNANGEAPMMSTPAAGCNASTCHTGTLKMTSP